MGMGHSELETTLAVEFLEKGLTSGYLLIIAKVYEIRFENCDANGKLQVRYNGDGR
jgi:hypothetical protein